MRGGGSGVRSGGRGTGRGHAGTSSITCSSCTSTTEVNMVGARNNNVNSSSSSVTNNQTTTSENRTITEIENLEVSFIVGLCGKYKYIILYKVEC